MGLANEQGETCGWEREGGRGGSPWGRVRSACPRWRVDFWRVCWWAFGGRDRVGEGGEGGEGPSGCGCLDVWMGAESSSAAAQQDELQENRGRNSENPQPCGTESRGSRASTSESRWRLLTSVGQRAAAGWGRYSVRIRTSLDILRTVVYFVRRGRVQVAPGAASSLASPPELTGHVLSSCSCRVLGPGPDLAECIHTPAGRASLDGEDVTHRLPATTPAGMEPLD